MRSFGRHSITPVKDAVLKILADSPAQWLSVKEITEKAISILGKTDTWVRPCLKKLFRAGKIYRLTGTGAEKLPDGTPWPKGTVRYRIRLAPLARP